MEIINRFMIRVFALIILLFLVFFGWFFCAGMYACFSICMGINFINNTTDGIDKEMRDSVFSDWISTIKNCIRKIIKGA